MNDAAHRGQRVRLADIFAHLVQCDAALWRSKAMITTPRVNRALRLPPAYRNFSTVRIRGSLTFRNNSWPSSIATLITSGPISGGIDQALLPQQLLSADARREPITPGSLDQHSARRAIPSFRDAALAARGAAGVL